MTLSTMPTHLTSRSRRFLLAEWWRSIDQLTLILLLCLLGAGVILSMAASPAATHRLGIGEPFYFLMRHMVFAGLGLCGAIFISLFEPRDARRIGVLALFGAVALMALLPSIGYEVKGAVRWVRLGPFGLQPSEFAKPAFIVFAAWMFAAAKRDESVPAVPIVLAIYGLLIALLITQPDFGQSFLLTLCFAAVFFFAGVSLGWVLVMMGVTVAGAVAAYMALPHVRARVSAFVSPDKADGYQTEKALEAIASGGFFGRGPGEGSVKYDLPDGHTDFIFAVTVEEFGFLISALLVLLIAAFVVRAFSNALRLNDQFCQLATAGLATMIGMQTIINLFVNLNMAPSKGMTLPFISSGGSSILALCFSAGLILAFTRRRPGAYRMS
ncbi:FtsW/RodA/SpoVE family cell cycle protein [Algimonas porphyrae]|uniref:Probable peptidoglycan glycosyltransferase FtsW n=1 Tax=Algimonas porphyrae TaxID=1128113 RepID=A0ABQ5UYY1_9PROT|nr:putative peptidoglycan glycosyltransferase FtsW [Algimonas porphyrae]GLQ20067.1 putative lipid II flippase FtsW [Algimonas porphyrae]